VLLISRVPVRYRRWLRRAVSVGLGGLVVLTLVVALSAWSIDHQARGYLYTADAVPPAPVALVLGAQVDPDGTPSPFLAARLALAQRLYETGKVKVLLVSGDNSRPDYDEPSAMRTWLLQHGIPDQRIVRDYAGFDTYDSCARAIRIFGVHRLVVVTQTFHLARAVALCRHLGIDATGVGDDSVRFARFDWWRASTREWGAAVKAAYDEVSGRDPVYLGRHETGVEDALHAS
jgi:vancomycin permeability regulator SanA